MACIIVYALPPFLQDNIFPCSVETIEGPSDTTKRHIVVVVTATQLLETCWEGGTGLLPHGIGPFSHGNLVVLHCVPLTDLRKVKKERIG